MFSSLAAIILLAPAAAFVPSRSFSARASRRRITMATSREDSQFRNVKLMLPVDSAAKKRRRVEEDENIDELQAPVDGQENPLMMAPDRSVQAVKEESFQGSTSRFGNNVVDAMRGNFWLGTVAPAVAVVWGGRKIITIRKNKFETRQNGLIKSYANEMMLNDGDMKALKRVHGDYIREVAKSKRDDMFVEYLRRFFLKQAISGDAVKSLALMVSLHKLSDEKAAELFLRIGEEFGAKKPVAVGKVLLLAERILKDTQALNLLQPLKDDITAKTYGKDPEVAAKLFDASQNMLLEAAIRQVAENLPETLETMDEARDLIKAEASLIGVPEEKAMGILDQLLEEARLEEESDSEEIERPQGEAMAALMEAAETKGEQGAPVAAGSGPLIVDCSNCGYVLFVAKGREEKFFGPDYTCPECGAPKSDMVVRPPKEE